MIKSLDAALAEIYLSAIILFEHLADIQPFDYIKHQTMPTPEEILSLNEYLANRYVAIAVMWHVIIVFLLAFQMHRKQTGSHLYYGLTGVLFLSVSVLALTVLNIFNFLVYFIPSLLLIRKSILTRGPDLKLSKSTVFSASAYIFILTGLVYPHFLNSDFTIYLVASPTGIVPCPTLLLASGISLLFVKPDHKLLLYILMPLNLVYGLIGIFILGVYIDALLVCAAIMQFVHVKLNHWLLKAS